MNAIKASHSSERSLKNYLYDNPELRESKAKTCVELDEDLDSDTEVWLFQCPKDVDPQQMMNVELNKVGKQSKVECSADRFEKTLAIIVPRKAEFELISDNIKLMKSVGKIIVNEKFETEEENRSQKRPKPAESSPLKKKKSKRDTGGF